jgi:hypothetical protein
MYFHFLTYRTLSYLTIGPEHVALAGEARAAGVGGRRTRHGVGDAEARPPVMPLEFV